MTYYADLSPCTYLDVKGASVFEGTPLLAVGWLARGTPFPTGEPDPRLVVRLKDWNAKQRFGILLGSHECELPGCTADRAQDTGELFVPRADGRSLYVAPAMIAHYVERHRYAPPAEFVQQLLTTDDAGIPRIVLDVRARKLWWDRGALPDTPVETRIV